MSHLHNTLPEHGLQIGPDPQMATDEDHPITEWTREELIEEVEELNDKLNRARGRLMVYENEGAARYWRRQYMDTVAINTRLTRRYSTLDFTNPLLTRIDGLWKLLSELCECVDNRADIPEVVKLLNEGTDCLGVAANKLEKFHAN